MPRLVQRRDPVDRFIEKVHFADSCWRWTGWVDCHGYGKFYTGGHPKDAMAHRFAWETFVGPIPPGHELDHVFAAGCDHRDCVNPDHLEPVTHLENMRRSAARQQNHCKRGHEFTSQNTRINPNGRRSCRACDAVHRQTQRNRRNQQQEQGALSDLTQRLELQAGKTKAGTPREEVPA